MNIVFKGEYLNGERNGKGNKYGNSKLQFDDVFLNGKRNGRGKEYDDKSNKSFWRRIFKWWKMIKKILKIIKILKIKSV